MKFSILFAFLTVLTIKSSFADLSDCILDAKTHGSHFHSISPERICEAMIKHLPERSEHVTPFGDIKVYGYQNMFYANVADEVTLVAGTQTSLDEIVFLRINERQRKILVYQRHDEEFSISTFNADFLGNVNPIQFYKTTKFNNLSNIILIPETEEMALLSISDKSISFLNMHADSRYEASKYAPTIKKVIKGEETLLNAPINVAYSSLKKEIYVLDSGRILVFSENSAGDVAPVRILSARGLNRCTEMKLNDSHTSLLFFDGTVQLPSLAL